MTQTHDPIQAILDISLATPGAEALDVMRLSLLDWLACGIAGRDEPVARIAREMALAERGAEQASLFGGGMAPARAAALVNGAASHALDYDDTHFAHIGHPSVAVLPAVFALAERQGADLDQVLVAALAGAEASVRFGLLFGRRHYQVGYHQTATAGAFGACVAAGLMLGLEREQLQHALSLVSTRGAGLKSQFGTMGKPLNAGFAASNGVEAAQLAAFGMTSNPKALTGQNGFLDTHHCDGALDLRPGFLMEEVSHKFHACCHGLHATLEALEMLKPLDPAQVEEVQITTHPRWLTVCNIAAPTTGLEAKFSYGMVTALSLFGYDTGALTTYQDALCTVPGLVAMRDKVSVHSNPELSETEALVRVKAGTWREARHDLTTPMDLAARSAKVEAKVAALLGPGMARDLQVHTAAGDLPSLAALLRHPA